MSLNSIINRSNYIGTGLLKTYSYGFKIFSDGDLKVVIRVIATGVETVLIKTADYTITGVGNTSGGSITLVDSGQTWLDGGFLDNTYALTIRRIRELKQPADIKNQGDFFPEVHESVFDKLTMVDQQQQDEIDRSIKFPDTIPLEAFNPKLPATIVGKNGASVITNSLGDGFLEGPTADQIANAQGYSLAALASQNAAAASELASATSATDSQTSADASQASADQAALTLASALWRDTIFITPALSPYNLGQVDNGKLFICDATAGPIVFNLPLISSVVLPINYGIKLEAGASAVTINRTGTDTIEGDTQFILGANGAGVQLIADDTPNPDIWSAIEFGVITNNSSVERFDGDGATTSFPLLVNPGSKNNTLVCFDGVYQQKLTYDLVGGALVFSTAPPTGVQNIEVTYGYQVPIGVPNDGTVTDLKLAPGVAFSAGDVKLTFKTVADPSWVMMNDGTIGSQFSGASARANADALNLYTVLWNSLPDLLAPVIGGRGASAVSDFNNAKPLTLVKSLGRALGVAGAGVGLSPRALGSVFGSETHTLTEAQLASHNHLQDPHAHGYLRGVPPSNSGTGNDSSGKNISAQVTQYTAATNQPAGGGQAHNNMQPTMFLNVMIKL